MINIKSEKEVEIMRQGGKILAHVLEELASAAKVGTRLADLDALAQKLIKEAGGTPSFKNYRPSSSSEPYPGNVCLSLNDEIVHGLAARRKLQNGDLLKIDLGVFYKGFHTDSAITFGAGTINQEARKLIALTQEALDLALAVVRPGATTGDIGFAVEEYVAKHGFSVIKELSGHGIGRELHEEPNIPNFGRQGKGVTLEKGMTLAIEPMVAAGKGAILLAEDGFTYKTADGSLTCHFEQTVAVTKDGCDVLTCL